MVNITGKVLRILPFKEVKVSDEAKKVVDLIIADELGYKRVSFWDDKAELVIRGEIKAGDTLRIENARVPEARRGGEKRVNAGKYTRITEIPANIAALSHAPAQNLTVLAVARPEKGQVCIAGIAENGDWIRPQGVYETDVFSSGEENFKNLCISRIYVDAWRGKRPRKEDRFFVYGEGVERELNGEEKREFLERNVDASVDAVFKSGRSLGLIKPRILHVYEEKAGKKTEQGKDYEQYIRFNFKDTSGRIYRRWSCRCNAFYKTWNELKRKHRWTYGLRMVRYLRKNETYLAIGLTYTDYSVDRLEYGAYPMIVGVHVVPALSF
ncbi:MAG: SOSS complex subunit B family protein [Halobacteriota archaeon]